MSGDGNINGISYQVRVIASVYVRMLAQSRLGWFSPANDVPTAVWGETGGPGDDARIEFAGGGHRISEVQAKHGLTAAAELDEVLDRIAQFPNGMPVALVLDESSTSRLYREFASDLTRIRSGNREKLHADARRLLGSPGRDEVLTRLFVVRTDLDDAHDAGLEATLYLLSSLLADESQTQAAWAFILADAMDLCAKSKRRDYESIVVDVLGVNGIGLRPPRKDEQYLRQIDFIEGLLDSRQAEFGLVALRQLAPEIDSAIDLDPCIHYEAATLKAAALLYLGRPDEALAAAANALDFDPQGSRALSLAARAHVRLGNLGSAVGFAEKAVAADSSDFQAWRAALEVAIASDGERPNPPTGVAGDPRYRLIVAEMELNQGDRSQARAVTAELLRENHRTAGVLVIRANALVSGDNSSADDALWNDVIRLTTEAIQKLDDADPLVSPALVIRSGAFRALGKIDDAQTDIEEARSRAPESPEILRHAVNARLATDDQDGALQILWSPAASRDAHLLAVRGGLRVGSASTREVMDDLEAALTQIPTARDPDSVRLLVADAAMRIGEDSFAGNTLDGLTEVGKAGYQGICARGRLAFIKEDPDEGKRQFENAAEVAGDDSPRVLRELAERLYRSNRLSDSIETLRRLDWSLLTSIELRNLAAALLETGDYAGAQKVLDVMWPRGPLPPWALAIAADIAFRREEPEAAIKSLSELAERGEPTANVRLGLAKALIDTERLSEASDCLDTLLNQLSMTPPERMQAAEMLRAVGRPEDAVAQAFRAYREEPANPPLNKALAGMVLTSGANLPLPTEVGADTYVRLKRANAADREYSIYSDPPVDPLRKELTLEDAHAIGLAGLKVGDTFILHRDTRKEERWTVDTVLPAVVHATQDILAHFEEQFAREPQFVEQIPVGEELDNPLGVAQLIEVLAEQDRFQQGIVDLYRQQVLPLAAIAQRLGCFTVELMSAATREPEKSGPLVVEWADSTAQKGSVRMASLVASAVLTRSALETAYSLQILNDLSTSIELVAPRSLVDEVRAELKEDQNRVRDGYRKVGGGAAGISLTDLPPNHPGLVRREEVVREQLAWLDAHRIERRPLESIAAMGSRAETSRGMLGRSSYDALVLVDRLSLPLYADDLGLRKFSLGSYSPPPSFSSVSLLFAMAERGMISEDVRDEKLLSLVSAHYVHVPPSVGLIDLAVQRASTAVGRTALLIAMGLLGGPTPSASESARVAVGVIKSSVLRPVQIVQAEDLAEMALRAMASRWRMPLCARLLSEEADHQLLLMPQYQEAIKRICAKFGGH